MRTLVTLFVLIFLSNKNSAQSEACISEVRRTVKIGYCRSGLTSSLTSIPDFDKDIEELHFEGQLLNILEENNFIHYDKLTVIRLKNNQIKDINDGCLKNLSDLKELDLATNQIKELPAIFRDTPHIEKIYLNNNKISILSDKVFSNLLQLKILHLQDNQISFIDQHCFLNLPAIFEINLSTNQIAEIPDIIIDKLSSLKVFDLNANPWNCDNSTCKFREYSLEKNWQISMPHCDTPESVKGKIWKELKNNTVEIKVNETEVEEGQNVMFACEYLACIPFKLTWKTKQNDILPNQTMRNLENKFVATLHLYNVAKTDEMNYVCSVEDCRECKEKDVYLKVLEKEVADSNSATLALFVVIFIFLAVAFVSIGFLCRNFHFGFGNNRGVPEESNENGRRLSSLNQNVIFHQDQVQNTSPTGPPQEIHTKEDDNAENEKFI